MTEDLKTEHEARLKSKEEIKQLKTELDNATVSKVRILFFSSPVNDILLTHHHAHCVCIYKIPIKKE